MNDMIDNAIPMPHLKIFVLLENTRGLAVKCEIIMWAFTLTL